MVGPLDGREKGAENDVLMWVEPGGVVSGRSQWAEPVGGASAGERCSAVQFCRSLNNKKRNCDLLEFYRCFLKTAHRGHHFQPVGLK